jgi:hypothetical protein
MQFVNGFGPHNVSRTRPRRRVERHDLDVPHARRLRAQASLLDPLLRLAIISR